jgi:hypothetical protein
MIVSPLAAVVFSFALEPTSDFRTLTFWAETFAVWTFAAYWIIKTFEMRETKAEARALSGELKREVVPGAPAEADASPVSELPRKIFRKKLAPTHADVERVVPVTVGGRYPT